MWQEPAIYWGGCGVCNCGVGINGYLVWNQAGTIGTFACARHLVAVKARNPKGETEVL